MNLLHHLYSYWAHDKGAQWLFTFCMFCITVIIIRHLRNASHACFDYETTSRSSDGKFTYTEIRTGRTVCSRDMTDLEKSQFVDVMKKSDETFKAVDKLLKK